MASEMLCQISDVNDAWPGFAALTATRQASLIARASEKILKFCNRWFFAAQFFHETFDGRNQPTLWLTNRPIISVVTVVVNTVALDNTYGTAWSFHPRTGKLLRGSGQDDPRFCAWFPAGNQNVQVGYYGGYQTANIPAVPDPVIEAACAYVKYLSDRTKASGVYKSESIGNYDYTINDNATTMTLPSHVADLLAEYVQSDGPL